MPDEKQILNAVKNALAADTTLAAYVKSFSIGEMEAPKMFFPFIAVGNLACGISPATLGAAGKDDFKYSLEIRCGTKCLVPEKAYSGENGILQLCEDIVSAAWPNDFGVFDKPVRIRGVNTAYKTVSGGSLWIGSVSITGEIRAEQ